ncbi:glycosyltransferase family 4 protein [uncultured Algibacter sp.]|uniref:glycosyltransferase family 4 protein n=1 Tax=uncultured Algibacter sp. TaxID=298659 RepID=UPI002608DB07|nr:glycosyltransferase family 4 protein [uncultured Algibacter sp.]
MNIAFITPEYPHKNLKRSAGLGSSIKNTATSLANTGHDITVFVVFQNEEKVFTDNGIKIISISRKGYKFFGWYLERKHIQKIIQKEIQETNIGVLEAPDWTGITAFMSFTIPLIIRLHGSDTYFCNLEGRKQKRKNHFFERKALNQADKIVSVSTFTTNLTKKLFNLECDIETIYNGINTDMFKPIGTKIKTGQILYFGTIIRKKGILELASIFNKVIALHNDVSLLLIGKDVKDAFENKSTLDMFLGRLTEKAKSKVTHLKAVPYRDIKNYIGQAQVVVLPSFAEAFPMTWLETLAMEKALVASNIGWAKELMEDGKTGYLVNPKNHDEFSTKIITLLKDEEKNKRFGINGRAHVISNFSTSVILKKNINFYKSLLPKND